MAYAWGNDGVELIIDPVGELVDAPGLLRVDIGLLRALTALLFNYNTDVVFVVRDRDILEVSSCALDKL